MEKHKAFEQGRQPEQSETSGLDMGAPLNAMRKLFVKVKGKVRQIPV